jgi:CheY-like chemotaxis protein
MADDARSTRILIVNDNKANRDILSTRLAIQGYNPCEAADGEEAIAAAKALSLATPPRLFRPAARASICDKSAASKPRQSSVFQTSRLVHWSTATARAGMCPICL